MSGARTAERLAVAGRELSETLGADAVVAHGSLAERCTYRVGGRVAWSVTASDDNALRAVADVAARLELSDRVVTVGNGSNLLVADGEHALIAVTLGDGFSEIDEWSDGLVVGGAARLPVAARRSVALGWTDFEWAVGVPGTLGGAVRMNAGGHGSDIASSLATAQVLDLATGRLDWWDAADLHFGYRSSAIRPHHIVTRARLILGRGDPSAGEALLSEIVTWRREHQPGGANAGSVFANPSDDSAGRLIDAAGLRGFRLGSAAVSDKHANFIQADLGGTAADVAALIGHVRRTVAERWGVVLVPENKFVGFTPAALVELVGPIESVAPAAPIAPTVGVDPGDPAEAATATRAADTKGADR